MYCSFSHIPAFPNSLLRVGISYKPSLKMIERQAKETGRFKKSFRTLIRRAQGATQGARIGRGRRVIVGVPGAMYRLISRVGNAIVALHLKI